MTIDFDIASYFVLAPGLVDVEDRRAWARVALPGMPTRVPDVPLVFSKRLPMMKARRMSSGVKLACEAALALDRASDAKAWVFSHRHGETQRGIKILNALADAEVPSPTDFMMSVHNAAAGMFTIEGSVHAPASSLAAGADSFHMALVEAAGMLADGMDCVAVVDFDDHQPEALLASFTSHPSDELYATAWLLRSGGDFRLTYATGMFGEPCLPCSLQLVASLAAGKSSFVTVGASTCLEWDRTRGERRETRND